MACLVLCMTTCSVTVILPIYPDQHIHLDLKLFNWGLLLCGGCLFGRFCLFVGVLICCYCLFWFLTPGNSVSWSFLKALVVQLLKITIVIHNGNNSHRWMSVTREVYGCKLPIKILLLHVSVSGCKTGFNRSRFGLL